jgi:hypothetical protein
MLGCLRLLNIVTSCHLPNKTALDVYINMEQTSAHKVNPHLNLTLEYQAVTWMFLTDHNHSLEHWFL